MTTSLGGPPNLHKDPSQRPGGTGGVCFPGAQELGMKPGEIAHFKSDGQVARMQFHCINGLQIRALMIVVLLLFLQCNDGGTAVFFSLG